MANTFCWHELLTGDPGVAKKFYGKLFDWHFEDMPMGDMSYTMIKTGEEMAGARGLNVERTKKLLFFSASLMTGSVVAFCGPIGFVGMMSPHICRLLVGADHRFLTPASFLFGGLFLALCDTLARTLVAPAEIPVGVITALLGGPFFIWLLLSRKGGLNV